MDDFFENIAPKVGLTADAFEDLSSEQKLGVYANALEVADVSSQERYFIWRLWPLMQRCLPRYLQKMVRRWIAYHPNADQWTASRTISLAGAAPSSVSINSSSNVTLTVSNVIASSVNVSESTDDSASYNVLISDKTGSGNI